MSSDNESQKKQRIVMVNESENDIIEINSILQSVKGRLDEKLIKLTVDVIMKTKWSQNVERDLYKINVGKIPDRSVDGVLLGSHIGQIYQISLDFARKMNINLKPIQKDILREMVFFLVVIRTERSKRRNP